MRRKRIRWAASVYGRGIERLRYTIREILRDAHVLRGYLVMYVDQDCRCNS